MNNRFVKIGEAAKLLGVSVQALRNWEMEGKIMPSHRTPGGQRMYDLAELLGVNDLTYPKRGLQSVSGLTFNRRHELRGDAKRLWSQNKTSFERHENGSRKYGRNQRTV